VPLYSLDTDKKGHDSILVSIASLLIAVGVTEKNGCLYSISKVDLRIAASIRINEKSSKLTLVGCLRSELWLITAQNKQKAGWWDLNPRHTAPHAK